MATQYIVTQLWSPRHIVTRGFGAFVPLVDLGQGEIIELGNANVSMALDELAMTTSSKELVARVTDSLEETVYVTQAKLLVARLFTEPSVLVER